MTSTTDHPIARLFDHLLSTTRGQFLLAATGFAVVTIPVGYGMHKLGQSTDTFDRLQDRIEQSVLEGKEGTLSCDYVDVKKPVRIHTEITGSDVAEPSEAGKKLRAILPLLIQDGTCTAKMDSGFELIR